MKTIFRKFNLTVGILLLTYSSSFAYDFQVDDLYYNILSEADATVEVTCKDLSYNNIGYQHLTTLTIPSEVTYNSKLYHVVAIGKGALSCCAELSDVTVPNSVTKIEDSAFSKSYKLTTITLSNNLTSIGKYAFTSCFRLTAIDIPNTVTTIGSYAFDGCNDLTSINIPEALTSIEDYTFNNCFRLSSIIIPNSITSIGYQAFCGCGNLKSVTIGNSVTTIGSRAFQGCYALTLLTFGDSVKEIGELAFFECRRLTSVELPNSVTTIGEKAFYYCSELSNVSMGNSVSSIGDDAFLQCLKLLNISVDKTNPNFSSVDGVLYDKNVTTIISVPTGKSNIILPGTVTTIGDRTFKFCTKLESVSISESVMTIGNSVFEGCDNLQDIIVDEGNPYYTSIDGVLYDKSYTTLICCPAKKESLKIPESVTTFADNAFYWCTSLTSIVIPDGVTSVGDTFSLCFSLETLTIGKSVSDIGWLGLCNSHNLATIYCRAEYPPKAYDSSFSETSYNGILYVPIGCKSAYEVADGWRNFRNIEEMNFSGIENSFITDNEPTISVDNGILRIDGIEGNESVLIYDIRGRMSYNGAADAIPNLSHGIYIIKILNKTAKVVI